MAAVITQGLTKEFRLPSGSLRAVDRLDLAISEGETFGLVGHNGAGKTTLFLMLNGLLRPTGGAAQIAGWSVAGAPDRVKAVTGIVTEELRLYDYLTVAETLHLFAALYRRSLPDLADWLELLGLEPWKSTPVGQLSTGLKKRVALLVSLVHRPRVLFLDEPFSGLDPTSVASLKGVLMDLKRHHGTTVVVASHNLHEIESMVDRVGIMQKGRLVLCGTLEHLFRATGLHSTSVIALDGVPDGPFPVEAAVRKSHPSGPVEVTCDSADFPALLNFLAQRSVQIRHVVMQSPTLEDVYKAFHRTQERGA